MKRVSPFLATALAALGALMIAGCASNEPHRGFAGGNGAFGEDPVQPGAYDYDNGAMPASHSNAEGNNQPTTSPGMYH